MSWYGWKPYVPVAKRRAQALKKVEKLRKKGLDIQPIEIEGRKIARTFWGEAWCNHIESFSDYANRLPRGRTYVRNGSVCHLEIAKGEVNAMVSGTEIYKVQVSVKALTRKKWSAVKTQCAGQIGSLLELLQGRFSRSVMTVVTDHENGLFPLSREISLYCDCPDWAVMCKHVAAVLYGVGARLDERPELLFLLRSLDHDELIDAEVGITAATTETRGGRKRIADDALADLFGIEMSENVKPGKTKSSQRFKEPKPTERSKTVVKRMPKRTEEGARRKNQRKKVATSVKVGVKKAPQTTSNARPVTGRAVAKLRTKFGMSLSQFAKLVGVSASSIGNWERKPGTLNFQSRTFDAWNAVKGLTMREAWLKLNGE